MFYVHFLLCVNENIIGQKTIILTDGFSFCIQQVGGNGSKGHDMGEDGGAECAMNIPCIWQSYTSSHHCLMFLRRAGIGNCWRAKNVRILFKSLASGLI